MTAPYYQDDLVTLYHGDALGLFSALKADVLVTDPPYGRAWKQGDTNTRRGWANDSHNGIQGDSDSSVRDTVLAVWGNRPGIVFGDFMVSVPSNTKHVLVYDKGVAAGFTGAVGGFRRNVEAIYLLGNGWASGLGGKSAVLTTSGVTGGNLARVHGHPHTKPEDLMRCLILATPKGVLVDPFCGSGSTLRAAKDLRRKVIGVEIEERYCEVAAKRCAQEVLF